MSSFYLMLNFQLVVILFLFAGMIHINHAIVKANSYLDQIADSTYADDIEIEGIIVDATQTKIGKDFYDLFYQQWNQLDSLIYPSITINERALPQLGSLISVQIQDQLIFQQVIQPKYEKIEDMANYAFELAYRFVENYDEMQNQLQGEDQQGTGIY